MKNISNTTSDLRESLTINRQWKFQFGDFVDAESILFDDTDWDTVGLPHSFSIPYFLGTEFYTGFGWYRKTISITKLTKEKRFFLEFDGVFQVTEVYVNGHRIGIHRGGYTGFSFDITRAVKHGDNLIAVRVNNLWDACLAPRAGEHVFSGGIYRDVRLVITSSLHVAWYGTFVTTPEVSRESATVNVKTEVVNTTNVAKQATIRQCILDPDGDIVTQMESTENIEAEMTIIFDQTSPVINNPKLWHPDHPNLYRVKTIVIEEDKVVDEYSSPLGFRWFKWTADKGFFLNGEHYYIVGANVHQDHAGWGDAVTQAAAYRDVKMVKDAGFNFIRGAHYPHSPAFSSACDKTGMLFWSEGVFWGIGGFGPDGFWNSSAYPPHENDQPDFENSVKQQLQEMIRIHRNHPSIVAWSLGNESFFSDKKVMPKVRTFLSDLASLVQQIDPTRPSANGGVQRGYVHKLNGTIAGYNGDGARLFIKPDVPNIVSEYGSIISDRPGIFEPGFGQLLEGPGDKSKPYFWRYPWRSGEVIWCAFDHGSIASKSFGSMGLVDYFRLPKRQWYWYRNEYRNISPPEWPVLGKPAKLCLSSDKNIIKGTDATDDVHLIVTVVDDKGKHVSNCPTVSLTVESGPGQFPTGRSITFDADSDITIRNGQAAIEFRSYHAGSTVIRAASEGLEDAVITIITIGQPVYTIDEHQVLKSNPNKHRAILSLDTITSNTEGNISLYRPTRASSEVVGHSACNINDGNSNTCWYAQRDDMNPWCGIDLENVYQIHKIEIEFPDNANYRYKIQVSQNELNWNTVIDESDTDSTDQIRVAKGDIGSSIRFLRVMLTRFPADKVAGITSLTVLGGTAQPTEAGKSRRKIIETSSSPNNKHSHNKTET